MKGQCLCGKTRFTAEILTSDVQVCHCSMCRRHAGGVVMSVDIVPKSLIFESKTNLKIYKSSDWGERGFCGYCGTALFWRLKNNEYCNVNVFVLDIPECDLHLDTELYIDQKPAFYAFKNHTKQMTEADVIELFLQSE